MPCWTCRPTRPPSPSSRPRCARLPAPCTALNPLPKARADTSVRVPCASLPVKRSLDQCSAAPAHVSCARGVRPAGRVRDSQSLSAASETGAPRHSLPEQAGAARQVLKSVAGQSAFQLAVMYALVFHGDALFGVPAAASVQGASVHYTLVFNAFVMMQLFNQAGALLMLNGLPHLRCETTTAAYQ